jgi:hypothetical protein
MSSTDEERHARVEARIAEGEANVAASSACLAEADGLLREVQQHPWRWRNVRLRRRARHLLADNRQRIDRNWVLLQQNWQDLRG